MAVSRCSRCRAIAASTPSCSMIERNSVRKTNGRRMPRWHVLHSTRSGGVRLPGNCGSIGDPPFRSPP